MEKIKMPRDIFVAALLKATQDLAVRRGYFDIKESEDRQKGIWGEAYTKMLELSVGQCTKQVMYSDDLSIDYGHKRKVEFDFRFANPRIHIYENDMGCAVEFSDAVIGEDDSRTHSEEWFITEMQIFREKGLKLYDEIKEAVKCAVCEITCELKTTTSNV